MGSEFESNLGRIGKDHLSLREVYTVNTEGTNIGNRNGIELQGVLIWFNAKTHSNISTSHFVKISISLNTIVSVCREENLEDPESEILSIKSNWGIFT